MLNYKLKSKAGTKVYLSTRYILKTSTIKSIHLSNYMEYKSHCFKIHGTKINH